MSPTPRARVIAETALAETEVSPEALESATSLLDMSKNEHEHEHEHEHERQNTSVVDFESEAYMLTVTLYVKDELESAGYPDIDRVPEVRSKHTCS